MDIDDLLKDPLFKALDDFLDSEFRKDKEVFARCVDVFEDERNARSWYFSKTIALGGNRPYDCSKEVVLDELGRIEYGVLS